MTSTNSQTSTAQTDLTSDIRAAIGEALGTGLDPAQDALPLSELYERYDSLAVIDCVGTVEQATGVTIDLVEDDLRTTFASVASIEALVRRKSADRSVLASDF